MKFLPDVSDLEQDIIKHLSTRPSDSNKLLIAITTGLSNYEQAIKQKRDGGVGRAVSGLYIYMNKKKLTHFDLALLIDSLFLVFPKAKATGHCGADTDVLKKYLEYVNILVEDKQKYYQWIVDTRGLEVAEWWLDLLNNHNEPLKAQ